MKEEVFTYTLPEERIAQRPVQPYDRARLLLINHRSGTLGECRFADLTQQLSPTDLLVLNDSRVIPARLRGNFSGGGEVEILLCKEFHDGLWRCLGRPLKKCRPGVELSFGADLRAVVQERLSEREILLRFHAAGVPLGRALEEAGIMPIPPYIRSGLADAQDLLDYQTLFARERGSIAAPTASLHFTAALFERIKQLGCRVSYLTLHVGPPSFLPLWNEQEDSAHIEAARPGVEEYRYSKGLLAQIAATKKAGGRVIAVGTTVVRALESMQRCSSETAEGSCLDTDLFVTPGFEFQAVDALITNFHQPRTTHLLLVQAFIGRGLLEQAYNHALNNNFRFLSYGDAMFIV